MKRMLVVTVLLLTAMALSGCSVGNTYGYTYGSPSGGQVPGWGSAATCPSC